MAKKESAAGRAFQAAHKSMQRSATAARKVQMQHAKSIKFPKRNQLQKRQEGSRIEEAEKNGEEEQAKK